MPFQASNGDACPPAHRVPRPHRVDQLPLAGDDAEQGVVVAGEALGGGVQHEVDAVLAAGAARRAWRTSSRRP